MPMNNKLTLCKKPSKLNLNQTPRKAVVENLISYSKSLQYVNASIGSFMVINN